MYAYMLITEIMKKRIEREQGVVPGKFWAGHWGQGGGGQ